MKLHYLSLVLLITSQVTVQAHGGHSHQPSTSAFSASDESKFSINSESGHLGHFYLKRIETRKNVEELYIRQTFHFEEDFTKNTKAKYDRKTSLLSYSIEVPDQHKKYFIYINLDNLDGTSNDGYRITTDTESGEVNSETITLSVLEPEDSHTH